MSPKAIKVILLFIIIYVFSSGISYALFTNLLPAKTIVQTIPEPQKNKNGAVSFDNSLPKTEPCPLNGALYSKQQRVWWEKHRPLGIMIENHAEARPQAGLLAADVIYEAVAEGGITRFLAIYYCNDAQVIGPIRSARTYFLDFISEYGDSPLYAHVGGANTPGPADALGQIESYGWQAYNDLNQFSIGFPVFAKDKEPLSKIHKKEIATEHTTYSGTSKLWGYAATERNLTNVNENGEAWDANFVPYKFKEDAPASQRPTSQTISFDFWVGYTDYSVLWAYDPKTNTYFRSNGGSKHVDLKTQKQLSAKNIVILFMTERNANDGYENNAHLLYGTKGTGAATIFMDGEKITGSWSKKDRTSRTIIRDNAGKQIAFNRGLIWFEILPGTELTVK